jgi:CYTH domain-containing protein
MNNTYTLEKQSIKEILDNIDNFMTDINRFSSKHKGYSYSININKSEDDLWDAEITINNETEKIKRTETAI